MEDFLKVTGVERDADRQIPFTSADKITIQGEAYSNAGRTKTTSRVEIEWTGSTEFEEDSILQSSSSTSSRLHCSAFPSASSPLIPSSSLEFHVCIMGGASKISSRKPGTETRSIFAISGLIVHPCLTWIDARIWS